MLARQAYRLILLAVFVSIFAGLMAPDYLDWSARNRQAQKLAVRLEDDSEQVRGQSMRDLSEMGAIAIPHIAKLLDSQDAETRVWALRGICATADHNVSNDDPDAQILSGTIPRLNREVSAPRAVPLLTRALSDPSAEVRRVAASGLGCFYDCADSSQARLIASLSDEDAEVRSRALNTLAYRMMVRSPELTSAVRKLLDDSDPAVAQSAREYLDRFQTR